MNIITAKNISKSYGKDSTLFKALDDLSFNIQEGAFVVIHGQSGSGKSTLLNLISGLDTPSSGELIVDKVLLSKKQDLSKFRQSKVAFIFQQFNLLPFLNVYQNIALPDMIRGKKSNKNEIDSYLKMLSLQNKSSRSVNDLSGGEKQRVAIARALNSDTKVILCDEPTGNLDSKNGENVMQILQNINKQGRTIILVTHNLDHLKYATQKIELSDGKLV